MKASDKEHPGNQDGAVASSPRRGRGRRRGSRNRTRRPATETVTFRGDPDDLRVIEGLVARARVRSGMKLKGAQVLRQAMEEYDAARFEGRNRFVHNSEPGSSNPSTNQSAPDSAFEALERRIQERREKLQHDLNAIMGRGGDE